MTIECLLGLCSPTAVAGLIVAVIVDSINGMLGCRPVAHICEEGLETLDPTITHRYTPAAIAVEVLYFRVGASSFDISPCSVFSYSSASMSEKPSSGKFGIEAPAGFSSTPSKAFSAHRDIISAFARTEPCSFLAEWCRGIYYSESSESLSDEIDLLHVDYCKA
jgi:hypothetical protein